jgi:hypothetical protein
VQVERVHAIELGHPAARAPPAASTPCWLCWEPLHVPALPSGHSQATHSTRSLRMQLPHSLCQVLQGAVVELLQVPLL